MALYEFYCESCQSRFESITSNSDPDMGKCPKCQGKNTRKLISKFFVAGRGDLRESSFYHGCHPSLPGGGEGGGHSHEHPGEGHGDGHDHDHSSGEAGHESGQGSGEDAGGNSGSQSSE